MDGRGIVQNVHVSSHSGIYKKNIVRIREIADQGSGRAAGIFHDRL